MRYSRGLNLVRRMSLSEILSLGASKVAHMLALICWSCSLICFAQRNIISTQSINQPSLAFDYIYPPTGQQSEASGLKLGSYQEAGHDKPCRGAISECKATQISPSGLTDCSKISLSTFLSNPIICMPSIASPQLQTSSLPQVSSQGDILASYQRYIGGQPTEGRFKLQTLPVQESAMLDIGDRQVPNGIELTGTPRRDWSKNNGGDLSKLGRESYEAAGMGNMEQSGEPERSNSKRAGRQTCNQSSDQFGISGGCKSGHSMENSNEAIIDESSGAGGMRGDGTGMTNAKSWFRERLNQLRLRSGDARRLLEQKPGNMLVRIEDRAANQRRSELLSSFKQDRLRPHRSWQLTNATSNTPMQAGPDEPQPTGELQSAMECSLRKFTFKAQRTDANGFKCWAQVSANICYGGCDTGEIADWLFPHKKSIHKVCGHGQRQRRRVYLTECDSPEFDQSLRDYYYVDAKSCVCQRCNSADSTCLGSLTRPYLEARDSSEGPSLAHDGDS